MDHEVIPCFSKLSDWLLNLSQDILVFTSSKRVRVTMELEVPKRPNPRCTLCTIMVQRVLQWETQAKEVLSLQMLGDYIYIYIYKNLCDKSTPTAPLLSIGDLVIRWNNNKQF